MYVVSKVAYWMFYLANRESTFPKKTEDWLVQSAGCSGRAKNWRLKSFELPWKLIVRRASFKWPSVQKERLIEVKMLSELICYKDSFALLCFGWEASLLLCFACCYMGGLDLVMLVFVFLSWTRQTCGCIIIFVMTEIRGFVTSEDIYYCSST